MREDPHSQTLYLHLPGFVFQAAWPARCHCLRPGPPIHRRLLAALDEALKNLDEDVNRILPSDGWASGKANSIERYLRTITIANERHWGRLLAPEQFSYNSHIHKATGLSPFEADTTENRPMPRDVMAAATCRTDDEAAAVSFTTKMNDILHQ